MPNASPRYSPVGSKPSVKPKDVSQLDAVGAAGRGRCSAAAAPACCRVARRSRGGDGQAATATSQHNGRRFVGFHGSLLLAFEAGGGPCISLQRLDFRSAAT